MFFNVSQLLREATGATRTYPIDQLIVLPAEGSPETPIGGELKLTRTNRGLLAQAKLRAATSVPCSRCLKPVMLVLTLAIEEEYLPTVDPLTGARLPEPDEPTPFRIDEHHHLDLAEAVRQAAVLAEPMQPLCRPDCQGLCPGCGADRNEGACGCAARLPDERWQALRGLKLAEERPGRG